jgi:hypothetical protein
MNMLSFEQSLAVASGLGYAVAMDASPEQVAAGIDVVVAVKVGSDVLCTVGLDSAEWRRFRAFKKVLKRSEYAHGKVVWLAI